MCAPVLHHNTAFTNPRCYPMSSHRHVNEIISSNKHTHPRVYTFANPLLGELSDTSQKVLHSAVTLYWMMKTDVADPTRTSNARAQIRIVPTLPLACFRATDAPLDNLYAMAGHAVTLLGPEGHDDNGQNDSWKCENRMIPQHTVGFHPHEEHDRNRCHEDQLRMSPND